jgi:hypothetical protein
MKKLLLAAVLFVAIQSCSNNGGESGAVDDGMKAADTNGALPDDTAQMRNGRIDTSAKGEDRVDIERRDSNTSTGRQ